MTVGMHFVYYFNKYIDMQHGEFGIGVSTYVSDFFILSKCNMIITNTS